MQILWCTKSYVQLWILSYSRHGVWVEGTSIHDETWSGHLPSETEIPSHFLTRPKVHLRLLIEWKLQMRKMIQLEMENESGNWALPDIWLMSATPSPRFTSSAFLDCHPPSLLFQNQVCHQAPPQYHISQKSPIFPSSQGIYRLLYMLMFSICYLVTFTNVFFVTCLPR